MNVRAVGRRAVLVDLPDLDAVHGMTAAVRAAGLVGVLDVVPGYRTLLVVGDDAAALAAGLRRLTPLPPEEAGGRLVELPVVYDGEDLAEVARLTGLGEDEVVRRHSGRDYLVAFLGFTPGFPYLVGSDPALYVPRRSTPRTTVPAGSVGLAGAQTGVYPRPSPGGWQLLGRTDRTLFDPVADPPALLAPGDRLRFVPVDAVGEAPVAAPVALAVGPVLVRRAGPLTTVQDLGRRGYAHLGVPVAGAADERSARLANRLVGNPAEAALLEVTLGGLELEFDEPAYVAVCGARAAVALDGRPVALDAGCAVPPGGVLRIEAPTVGLRCYLALRGGIDVPPVLGSRSADTLAGLGPGPLRDGDRLPVGAGDGGPPVYYDVAPTPPLAQVIELRVVPGPREDWFEPGAMETLFAGDYAVTSTSDRTGLRLDGPALARSGAVELPSEPMVAGALQVPPQGTLILFLANCPTTGGYPVVGVVLAEDLPLAGQAAPGTALRFRPAP